MSHADGTLIKIEAEDPEESRITLDQVKRVLPKGVQGKLGQTMVDRINDLSCGENRELYRENIIGYAGALRDGHHRMEDYINAVKYVTHKLMGDTNITAYTKTFPERYQAYLDKGYEKRHIDSVVSIFNKNVLVNKVYEQTLIPTHIINADLHQKAINHLAHLMLHARSEKVQGDSAAKLVDALKVPETTKIELDVSVGEDQSIRDLRATTMELVAQQRAAIKAGAQTAKEIAHSKIISETVVEGEIVG